MSTKKSVILLVVCTCLALCLIIGLTPASTLFSADGDGTASDPSTATQNAIRAYAVAKNKLLFTQELSYSYTYQQTRIVGGETYTETRSGTAGYTGLGTDDLEALVQETAAYGSYSTHFTESYLGGRAYCQVRGTSFACDMDGDAFLARQIPADLLDETLYSTGDTSGNQITFSDATALEDWADPTGEAEVIAAGGSVTLDASGNITAIHYQAEYTIGAVPYTLEVTMTPAVMPDMVHPEYPESCAVLSDLDIPRYMLRTVGSVYSTASGSAEYTESLYFGVLQEQRIKTGGYYFHGAGSNFLANLTYQNIRSTATGSSSASSQNNTFRDGQYSCILNGGEAQVDSSFTAENVRALCDDSILSAMMILEHIAGAQITDDGDFLRITFQGNDAFLQYFCGNIYTAMGLDTSLDLLAESIENADVSGYLVMNKYTGLPCAMGLSLIRTHVLNGLSYEMSYQLDQSLTLSCPNAYQTITGETMPLSAEETATPPFYCVTGENGQKLWLLGSTNVVGGLCRSLDSRILDALSDADALALEYDPIAFMTAAATDGALRSQLSALYYYPDSLITDHLSAGVFGQLYPLMVASGYPNSMNLKPIIWQSQIENLYLSQSYGLTGLTGSDGYLVELAQQQAKPIYEMESGLTKLESLTGLSDQVQELLLQRLLEQGMQGYYEDQLLEYTQWCRGDVEGFVAGMAHVTEGMTPEQQAIYAEYHQALVTDRTAMMLQAVTGYLESGETVFCTVDIHNLLGEEGLAEALRAAGYTVEMVSYE